MTWQIDGSIRAGLRERHRGVLASFAVTAFLALMAFAPNAVANATTQTDFTVTFEANDGSGTMAPQVASSATALAENAFTRENFRFTGWNTESGGGGEPFSDEQVFGFDRDLTLYAQWAVDGFVVTFNANGAAGSMNAQVATVTTALSKNTFTFTNRSFLGWTTNQDGSGDSYVDEANFPFTASGTQVLYAQWSDAAERTVTFLPNGGAGDMDEQRANEPSALNANEFTRANFTFSGWNTQADGEGTAVGDREVFNFETDVELYAQWVPVQMFSVTFNANGGSGTMNTQTSAVPATLTSNEFTFTNRAFSGWATSANGPVVYGNDAVYDFDANITLFARWVNAITVTFDKNDPDATGSMGTQQVGAGTTLIPNAFSLEGYVFSHWNTQSDGLGTSYPDGWSGPPLSGAQKFFAQWEQVGIGQSVTFNANGGGSPLMVPQFSDSPTVLNGNSFSAPDGREFMSWNTQADGSGDSFTDGQTYSFDQNVILFAQWGFELTLRPNGGLLVSNGQAQDTSVVVSASGPVPLNPFERTGHEFIGWSTSGTPGTNTAWFVAGEPIALDRPRTLFAEWAPVSAGQKAVGFVARQGRPITGSNFRVSQAESGPANLAPRPFVRNGWTFQGWSRSYTSNDVEFADGALFPFDESTLLFAVWARNTVTFDANGGIGTLQAQSSSNAAPLRVNGVNAIRRDGHIFAGWNTAPDGTGQAYAQGAGFPFNLPDQTLTLYAQWVPIDSSSAGTKNVQFSGNGATAGFMPPQQADDTQPLRANTFTRTGYQFAGWNTLANRNGTGYGDEQDFDFANQGNIILHAQWTPLITFRGNFSGAPANYTQVVTQSPVTLDPNRFSRSGHKFVGWATGSGGNPRYVDGERLSISSVVNQGTQNLYAVWEEVSGNESLVVYVSNFGDSNTIRTQTGTPDTALTGFSFNRGGHTLLGWSTSPTGAIEWRNGDLYAFDVDLTLFAIWEQNTVVFDANGGSGTMAPQTSTTATGLTSNAFEREGFVFDGWSTVPNGSIAYSEGSSYPFNGQSTSTTLYARWAPLDGNAVVSFLPNLGLGSMAAQTAQIGSTLTLAPNVFSRDGHTFVEWNTQADGAGTAYSDGSSVTVADNLTLYAQWVDDGSIVERTVTFDANLGPRPGAGDMADQAVTGRTTLSPNAFTRDDSIFTGWNTSADGSGTGYADLSQIFTQTDVTLYARWLELAPGQRAIQFQPNGGSGSPITPLSGAQGAEKTLPLNQFSRPGFEFVGWNTQADGEGTRFAPGDPFTIGSENVVLFAEWEQAWRVVTFDPNGGIGSMSVQSADKPQNLSLNSFSRSRFSFLGWSTDQDATTATFSNGAEFDFTADATLYAIWEQIQFTVTFNPNGGTGSMPPQTAGSATALAGNTFTRANHVFLGWSTDPGATTVGADDFANSAEFDFTADTTLYAVWQEVSTVTFDKNEGDGDMSPQSSPSAAPLVLSEFTRAGYTFTGWNTVADGSGNAYADGVGFAFTESVTLYAQWELTTYRVTFNANGATGGSMSAQVSATATNLSPATLTRTSHVFRGWSTSPNATTAAYTDEAIFPFTQDTILYAVWSPVVTVTYQANGGGGQMAVSRSADPENLRPVGFTRPGFAFAGWNTRADGDGTPYADEATFPYTQSRTLYAQWLQTTFTVTFQGNGGSGSMTDQTGEAPTALRLNSFSRPGFSFVGWATSSSATEPDYTNGQVFAFAADTTLYALWQASTEPTVTPGLPSPPRPSPPTSPAPPRPTVQQDALPAVPVSPSRPEAPVVERSTPEPPAPNPQAVRPAPTPTPPTTPTPPPTESSQNTVDFGAGPTVAGAVTGGAANVSEQARRSVGELRSEEIGGFVPSSTLTIEVAGSRTLARFILTTVEAIDAAVVAQTIAESARFETSEFSRLVSVDWRVTPRDIQVSSEQERSRANEVFAQSRLDTPRWLSDLDVSPDMSWISVEMFGETYLPGSPVFLTFTSDPIVIAVATADEQGMVTVNGSVPLDVLGAGEHRIRLVGTRTFDGISVGQDGSIVIPEAVMESITEFDLGTQATVTITGANESGGVHQAIRVIPLDFEKPWWTIWVLVWTALLMAMGRYLGKIVGRGEKVLASTIVLVSSVPAVYFGWQSTATEVAAWGAGLGLVLSVVLWAVPVRRRAGSVEGRDK